ncbi:MAG: ABC transporter substrate-binding protein [Anaerolineae bacterium]|nr:ABC transporter substrate-binding protein [Anaerolineae bacterium]
MLLALGLAACGGDDDSTQKQFKIGILNPIDLFDPSVEGFKTGMAALGYVEGQNIAYEYDGPVGNFGEGLATYAQTLVEHDVDLIFAITTPGALAAQSASKTIPIIFTLVTDPVGAGFVASWPQPGGNMTGVSDANPDSRRLQILKQVLPDMQRVYLPLDTRHPGGAVGAGRRAHRDRSARPGAAAARSPHARRSAPGHRRNPR